MGAEKKKKVRGSNHPSLEKGSVEETEGGKRWGIPSIKKASSYVTGGKKDFSQERRGEKRDHVGKGRSKEEKKSGAITKKQGGDQRETRTSLVKSIATNCLKKQGKLKGDTARSEKVGL